MKPESHQTENNENSLSDLNITEASEDILLENSSENILQNNIDKPYDTASLIR